MRLVKRHLHLFFKEPMNLLISMLSVVVILSLYFLFIRDFTLIAVKDIGANQKNVEQFVDLLMVAGLLIVIGTTSCLPICSIFVKDKENGIIKDFFISPISKSSIYLSYIITASIISIAITVLVFFIVLLFFYYHYHFYLPLEKVVYALFILILNSIVSASLLLSLSLPFKTMTSFSSFGNLFGVIIGFLTGVYIPIGYYPQSIQHSLFTFPMSQTTSLLRQIMTETSKETITSSIPELQNVIDTMFGLKIEIGKAVFSASQQILYVIIILVFLTLVIWLYSKKYR